MTNNGAAFEFVVQDHSGEWFLLDIRPYDAAAKPWFASVWQRTSAALAAAHQQTDSPAPAWLQWKPWDWCERKRPGYEDRDTLVGCRVNLFRNDSRGGDKLPGGLSP